MSEREKIYNLICSTLTEYEQDEEKYEEPWDDIFYELLCKIQARWDDIVAE